MRLLRSGGRHACRGALALCRPLQTPLNRSRIRLAAKTIQGRNPRLALMGVQEKHGEKEPLRARGQRDRVMMWNEKLLQGWAPRASPSLCQSRHTKEGGGLRLLERDPAEQPVLLVNGG